jgi:hypothetical protein
VGKDFYIPDDLNLRELLIQTGRSELCTDLIVDKAHYIIDRLYLNVAIMKYKWQDFAPLHSQVLAEVLGTRDGPMLKKVLLKLGIIEVHKKDGRETYERGKRSKCYRLSKTYWASDFRRVPIRDRGFIELLERKRVKRNCKVIGNNSVRQLVARSVENLDYNVDAAQEFIERARFKSINSENAYSYAVECYKSKEWLFASDAQGRLYHNMSQMARKLRRFASYNGKRLFAADISACQPCLLSLLYTKDCEEKRRYAEIVKNNEFYAFLNDRLDQPYDLSDEDSKGEFKEEVFHRIFYGSNWAEPSEMSEIFASEFPILANLIKEAKRHHKRDLPVKLQRIEADIVVGEVATELARLYSNRDLCLITVHDCIVTTEEYVHECADRLRSAFGNRLGFEPIVKEKQVTDDCVLDQANIQTAWAIVSEEFERPEIENEILDQQDLFSSLPDEEAAETREIPEAIEQLLEYELELTIRQYEKEGWKNAELDATDSAGDSEDDEDKWITDFPWTASRMSRHDFLVSMLGRKKAKHAFLEEESVFDDEVEEIYRREFATETLSSYAGSPGDDNREAENR